MRKIAGTHEIATHRKQAEKPEIGPRAKIRVNAKTRRRRAAGSKSPAPAAG